MTAAIGAIPTLATDRLVLRAMRGADYPAWVAGFRGRSPAVSRFDEGPPPLAELSPADFASCLERYERWAKADETYVMGIFLAATGDLAGIIDLFTYVRDDRDFGNLGFFVHNQFQRRGIASEALRAARSLAHGALDYQRIEAAIRPENAAALAAVRSAGMDLEGTRPRFWRDPDGWADHVIYASVRP